MKILHICLCGPFSEGFSYQENLLTKYQVKMGLDVCIITSRWGWGTNGELEKNEKGVYVNDDGVKVYRLNIKKDKPFNNRFRRYEELFESIDEEKPDILFVHGVSFLDMDQIKKYVKKHRDVTVYVDNHADLTNSGTNWLSKNVLQKIIWRYHAHMIEPYTKKFYGVLPIRVDFLKDIYVLPAEKCELLVMGGDDELIEAADTAESKKAIRQKYGLAEDDFVIMTGGKIDAFKTQTFLLMEAVQKIQNPKVKLIVFGSVSADLRARMDALADGKKIQYIGWVQAKDSFVYFAAADLVVFPGRHSVFWEQVVAQGIPMICKQLPGTDHVDLGGNVRFLENDSVDEIQTCIEELLTDRAKYDSMKKIAMEKGMKEFSYKDIAKRSIEVTK